MAKKIDNRQKNLAHRVSGRTHSAGVGALRKQKRVPVLPGAKKKRRTIT